MQPDTPETSDQDSVPDDAPSAASAPSASGSSGAATRRLGPLAIARWALRGLLLLVALICLVVLALRRAPSASADPSRGDWALTLTLADGPNYGDVLVYAGQVEEGAELTDASQITDAASKSLASTPEGDVLLAIDGGVSLQEVERVRRLISEAQPACRIHLVPRNP